MSMSFHSPLPSYPSRADMEEDRERRGLALIAEKEARRREALRSVYECAAEQVAELTHVDPNAILECKTASATAKTPINAPALNARNLAIYIMARAGLSTKDISILTGVGLASIGYVLKRMTEAVVAHRSTESAVNVAIANVTHAVFEAERPALFTAKPERATAFPDTLNPGAEVSFREAAE